jgi:hypothetical protein
MIKSAICWKLSEGDVNGDSTSSDSYVLVVGELLSDWCLVVVLVVDVTFLLIDAPLKKRDITRVSH